MTLQALSTADRNTMRASEPSNSSHVQQTSVDALKQSIRKRTEDEKRVIHLLKTAQLAGMDGLTGRELCQHYQDTFNDFFPPNEASARLHRLRSWGLVVREKKRPCSVTGEKVWVHFCPMQQANLLDRAA